MNVIGCYSLRKKGGIFIKKLNIFLIIFFGLLITNIKANAATFYEGEYISNIYLKRYNHKSNLTYYQQARFFRKSGTNDFVYCLEPFIPIDPSIEYQSTTNPTYLTEEQRIAITKLAYFGYGYGSHTDSKWYIITQVMIWRVTDPEGDFYFTDRLNGNRVDYYQKEMNEINSLIEGYSILPSFANQTFDIVNNQTFILEDPTYMISKYVAPTSSPVKIEENKLIVSNIKSSEYKLLLTENITVANPTQYYFASSSQNLVQRGHLEKKKFTLTFRALPTTIKINKIDKDTKSTTPSGEASFQNTTFSLLNSNKEKIKDLVLENNQIILNDLPYNTYYIQESNPGTGYQLNNNLYEITLDKDNTTKTLNIENEVIKKKIKIIKKYGTEHSLKEESNISFSIKNNKNELIKVITTNNNGLAEITLPYGTYTITQLNTTDGYELLNPFQVEVKDIKEEVIELKDIEIPVPDTYLEEDNNNYNYNLYYILLILIKVFIW